MYEIKYYMFERGSCWITFCLHSVGRYCFLDVRGADAGEEQT